MVTLTNSALCAVTIGVFIAQPPCSAQVTEGSGNKVQVGVAPASEVGSLPPLTSAIGKRAAKAFLHGNCREARDAYLEILKSDPENAPTLTNLGATFLELQQYDEARRHLEKAQGGPAILHRIQYRAQS